MYNARVVYTYAPFPHEIERVRRPLLGGRREWEEKKYIYIYVVVVYIYRNLSFSERAWMQSDGCSTCACTFFYPLLRRPPPKTFFSILSRGYRVTGLLKWPEHCSASRVARTRVPAVTEPTVRFRHVANEKNRATENEKQIDFSCESRIVFIRNPSMRHTRVRQMHINIYEFLHWEKNIVNFNKYLIRYCQLNIYLQ